MERKYKIAKFYLVYVDGRCFQKTESESRKDELLKLLPKMYVNSKITVEEKRERKYYYC